ECRRPGAVRPGRAREGEADPRRCPRQVRGQRRRPLQPRLRRGAPRREGGSARPSQRGGRRPSGLPRECARGSRLRVAAFGRALRGAGRMTVPEAELVSTERGLVPKGEGWFVLNARETQWWERPGRGVLCEFEGSGFEGTTDFHQVGINLTRLDPGEPMAM